MPPSGHVKFSIEPLHYRDVPTCARITSSAFSIDPHTLVKNLGRNPYDMYAISRSNFLDTLERRTYIYVKAVDTATGEIAGHAGWAFRGVDKDSIPWNGPKDKAPVAGVAEDTEELADKGKDDGGRGAGNDLIEKLHALEQKDTQDWLSNLVPADKPCMFVVGLIVSPSYQSQGIGTALLQHGNAIADNMGLDIWVHSSHQAYLAYAKSGFEVARSLEIDLDEYAPRPPREGEPVMGEEGRWGEYVIRYMRRTTKKEGVLPS